MYTLLWIFLICHCYVQYTSLCTLHTCILVLWLLLWFVHSLPVHVITDNFSDIVIKCNSSIWRWWMNAAVCWIIVWGYTFFVHHRYAVLMLRVQCQINVDAVSWIFVCDCHNVHPDVCVCVCVCVWCGLNLSTFSGNTQTSLTRGALLSLTQVLYHYSWIQQPNKLIEAPKSRLSYHSIFQFWESWS